MKNPFIIAFSILEGFLFFGWIMFVFGSGKRRTEEKRIGFALFVAWLAVLAVGILLAIVKMLLEFFNS
jgi:hypothetical protein